VALGIEKDCWPTDGIEFTLRGGDKLSNVETCWLSNVILHVKSDGMTNDAFEALTAESVELTLNNVLGKTGVEVPWRGVDKSLVKIGIDEVITNGVDISIEVVRSVDNSDGIIRLLFKVIGVCGFDGSIFEEIWFEMIGVWIEFDVELTFVMALEGTANIPVFIS